MRLYSYKIVRDYGFAPNPYKGVCSLATCKPMIRSGAQIGDWIAGFAGVNTGYKDRLVYLMQISETCSFNQYWEDERFNQKKPRYDRKYLDCYGDNIYHMNERGGWYQENSHHSYEDGINNLNLIRDTRVDRVLLSNRFWYFGCSAIELPGEFKLLIPARNIRNCFSISDQDLILRFEQWMEINFETGVHDYPFSIDWKRKTLERYDGK